MGVGVHDVYVCNVESELLHLRISFHTVALCVCVCGCVCVGVCIMCVQCGI